MIISSLFNRYQGGILVYQMGKVGSKSIFESLASLDLNTRIDHVHFLNHLDAVEEAIRQSWYASEAQLVHLEHCRRIRSRIDASPDDALWHIITLIRDPVARSISSFFYNTAINNPELLESCSHPETNMHELHQVFMETIDYGDSSHWFDNQVKPVFNIDVFQHPVPAEHGYHIYRRGNVRLLLIKLEHLTTCASAAIGDFLGLQEFSLSNRNRAADTPHARLYHRFKNTLRLPMHYLDQAYQTRLVQHFYSPEEIAQFKHKWTQSG